MQAFCKNKGAALLCAVLMVLALVLLPAAAYAEDAAQPAAVPTITGEPYYGTDYAQFTINQNGAAGAWFYDVTVGGETKYKHVLCNFTDGVNKVGWQDADAADYRITVYQGYSADKAAAKAEAGVTVIYAHYDGGAAVPLALYPAMGGNAFTPNQAVAYNGADYDLDYQDGTDVYYKTHTDAPLTGSVTFINLNGDVLDKTDLAGITRDNPVTYPLPEELQKDGVAYVRPAKLESVTAQYNGQIHFTVTYTRKLQEAEKAYTAEIRFVSGSETVMTDTVYVNKQYTYTVPTVFARTDNGVTTQYTLADTLENNALVLKPGDAGDDTRKVYTVQYDAVDPAAAAYTWQINAFNGVTGEKLTDQCVTLTDKAKDDTYTPGETIIVGGEPYELVGEKTLTFDPRNSVQSIYYVPAGYTPETSYTVTVKCINIADNTVLTSTEVEVLPGQDAALASNARLEVNGEQYVRLKGQNDTWAHGYYSPRRTYTVYYRNINDTLYVDTTVTEVVTVITSRTERTVIYVPGETTEQIVYDGTTYEAGLRDGETVTAANNATTGDNELRTENGQTTQEAQQEIEENETPLAGPDTSADGDTAPQETTQQAAASAAGAWADLPMTLALIGAAALILLLIVLIIRQRRENEKRRADR